MNKLNAAAALIFVIVGVYLSEIRGEIILFKDIFNYSAASTVDIIFWGLEFLSSILIVLFGITAGVYILDRRRYKVVISSLFVVFISSSYSLFAVYTFLVKDAAYLNEFIEYMAFCLIPYISLILVVKSKQNFRGV